MSQRSLDPHMWNLENLFKSIFNVPVYQRPYSWDREQVEVLLNDIYEAYTCEEKEEGYYTGNIIIFDKGDKINGLISKYDIIDGQQRITTFSLILLAVYCLALKDGANKSDTTILAVKGALWKLVNREYQKKYCVVKLNSIEKKCFSELFDRAYDQPERIYEFCDAYKCESKFDERVIGNFRIISGYISNKIMDPAQPDAILDYADYILQYVQFIAIEANCKENKVFSMFESINSKGKRLEEIDLIKTYIFSQLDEASYSTYLDRWGQLIILTNDNLYDYLYNYIKAFLCFYRQNISVENFKTIAKRNMLTYFNVKTERDAFKMLLDDMYNKVDIYNMLYSAEKAYSLVKNHKFRFFYKIFTEVAYKHPKALFLRALVEYKEGNLSKEDITDIVRETVGFMIKFLTISNRDSKDAITMFSAIMNDIYANGKVVKDNVINALAAEYVKQGINTEKLKNDLNSVDAYEQNKKLTVALLVLYESTTREADGTFKTSYDQAYTLLDSFSESFSLDHLLVQSPDKNSEKFYYYKNDDDTLVLKPNHDFPANIVVSGMDYDTFLKSVLNKIGNLRIYYRDKNSGRQNTAIALKEYAEFCTYADIVKRSNDINTILLETCLPQPDIDVALIQKSSKKISESALPKMDKLIEYGFVKPGDELYIVVEPDNSAATLIDEKYVMFNGEQMTLNEWGCKVTGWKSIRIYAYAAKKGELETLQEKRMFYIQEHNESIK